MHCHYYPFSFSILWAVSVDMKKVVCIAITILAMFGNVYFGTRAGSRKQNLMGRKDREDRAGKRQLAVEPALLNVSANATASGSDSDERSDLWCKKGCQCVQKWMGTRCRCGCCSQVRCNGRPS